MKSRLPIAYGSVRGMVVDHADRLFVTVVRAGGAPRSTIAFGSGHSKRQR
jgi:hypothetical protein